MIYLLLLFLIGGIIFSIYKEKNLYNPLTILFFVWLVVVAFASLKLYKMMNYSLKTIIIIFIGLIFFFLGTLVIKKRKVVDTSDNFNYNWKLIRVFLIIGILLNIALSIKVVTLLLNGTNYSFIRSMYYSYEGFIPLFKSGALFTIFDFISTTILYISIPIVLSSIFCNKKDQISIILLCILLILFVFCTAGRTLILHVIIDFAILTIIFYKNISKNLKKTILISMVLCICLILGSTFLRNGRKSNSVPTVYSYLGCPVPIMSEMIEFADENNIYLYGKSSFYGFYLYLQKFSVAIFKYKFKDADYLNSVINRPTNMWINVFKVNKDTYNAFATMFYNIYLDFKIIGVIIICFCYGAFVKLIYEKSKSNLRYLVFYLIIVIGLVFSFEKFQFSSYYVYSSFVLSFFLIYNHKCKINKSKKILKGKATEIEKVSVVITTHNRIKYLKKAVKSVLKQTYKNIELIIVDDCSTDGTKKYCKTFKNIKYIYIPKSKHRNGNYARNLGLEKATGEYIAFLDDDDEWLPTKIEKQVEVITSDNSIGLVYTGTTIEVNDGLFKIDNSVNLDLHGDCSKKSLYNIITSTSTMLFRKSALEEINGWDENINYWQDNEMLISVSQKYKIEYVNENLTIYRELINDSKKISNNVNGFLDSVNKINSKYKKEISNLSESEKVLRDQMIYNDVASRYIKVKNYKECRKYLYKSFKTKPTLKAFVKYLLNYTSSRKLRLIVKIMNLRGNKK